MRKVFSILLSIVFVFVACVPACAAQISAGDAGVVLSLSSEDMSKLIGGGGSSGSSSGSSRGTQSGGNYTCGKCGKSISSYGVCSACNKATVTPEEARRRDEEREKNLDQEVAKKKAEILMKKRADAVARAQDMQRRGVTGLGGLCLRFIGLAYGRTNGGAESASKMAEKLKSTMNPSKNGSDIMWFGAIPIPKGAMVFFDYGVDGHVGLADGSGKMINVRGNGNIQTMTIDQYLASNPNATYKGWSMPPDDYAP